VIGKERIRCSTSGLDRTVPYIDNIYPPLPSVGIGEANQ